MDKKIKKQIIKMQNAAAGRGDYIPSVAECRAVIEKRENGKETR